MAKLSVEQHRLTHRGRAFHFVSYEGQPANPKRNQDAIEPAWFLMLAGKRWEVMPHVPGQDESELTQRFTEWLDEHAFA